jgi:hypothetical protein
MVDILMKRLNGSYILKGFSDGVYSNFAYPRNHPVSYIGFPYNFIIMSCAVRQFPCLLACT